MGADALAEFIKFSEIKKDLTVKAKNYIDNLPCQPLMPSFNTVQHGAWEIENRGRFAQGIDYIGQVCMFDDVRLNKISGEEQGLWMSLTPMEFQSSIVALNNAIKISEDKFCNGEVSNIVIGGLGMGMFLLNLLCGLADRAIPANITVIEKSKNVHDLLMKSLVGDSLDIINYALKGESIIKLNIIIDDINTIQPIKDLDFLFIDIWQGLGTEEALIESKVIVDLWNPLKFSYWGEELDISAFGRGALVEQLNLACKYDDESHIAFCDAAFLSVFGCFSSYIKLECPI